MFVTPKVYFLGMPSVDLTGLLTYLRDTEQQDFIADWDEAKSRGVSDSEALCSFYAKLCYKSLVLGKNENISSKRSIWDNFLGILDSAHGSVLEHMNLNFVCTNCSRVLTHELVRHRAGWAYSQTSGRYCRPGPDGIDFVHDPILDPVADDIKETLAYIEERYQSMVEKMGLNQDKVSFDRKKKITSALRRILPNGQANEIGFSINFRSIRHFLQTRSSRHAEWEIRCVAAQVYDIVCERFPLLLSDAKVEVVERYAEITGMKIQPYEK